MGMFDTAIVPIGGTTKEFQFKVYLGRYRPYCNEVSLGERIDGFPRIPFFEVCDSSDQIVLQFEYGYLVGYIYPKPREYECASLPEAKEPKASRKRLAREEEIRRKAPSTLGANTAGEWLTSLIRSECGKPGFTRRLLSPPSPYRRYAGKWVRVLPLYPLRTGPFF